MCSNCKKKLSVKKMFLMLSILALGVLRIESFAHDHGQTHHHNHNHNDDQMNHKTRKSLTKKTKKALISVLEANEKLHSAFFKYDSKAVEASASKLKKAMNTVKDKKISKLLKFSKQKLSNIKRSNDRETNNKNYHLVSMALIYIINKYDVGSKYSAYSCPMVKRKWIQNNNKMKKVYNPYAPKMPHCGSQES